MVSPDNGVLTVSFCNLDVHNLNGNNVGHTRVAKELVITVPCSANDEEDRQPNQVWLDRMTLAEAREYIEEGHFAKGSMEPKIKAIIGYLEQGGKKAIVTDPMNIARALTGETGTTIVPD